MKDSLSGVSPAVAAPTAPGVPCDLPMPGDLLPPADSASAALAAAHALREAGALPAAELRLRDALAADPACAEAHATLAELLVELGRLDEAVDAYRSALAYAPDRSDWQRGLAEALAAAGRLPEAVTVYEVLAARRPDSAGVRRALGRLLARLGRTAEAMAHLREARFLDPHDADTALDLARLLTASGDPAAAVEVLQAALRRDPELAPAYLELGRAWAELGERERALAALRACAARDPEDALGAEGEIARLTAAPAALTRAYVRTLFDQYADRFDESLTVRLRYRAPEALRAAVDRVLGVGAAGLDVLDLGCGTGLAGVAFRPLARRLAGVDLAPRMVAQARARGIYDALEEGDLVEALARTPAAWDLLVAADVLVYVGELAPVMTAAAAALRPGGLFAATVERLEGDGFVLHERRRFAYSAAYLRRMAAAAGLEVVRLEPHEPRCEAGAPVPGWLFVLRRP